jgi:ketosteroid isomerase-like protein
MPDWKDNKYVTLRRFIASFEKAMVMKDAGLVVAHFSRKAVLHRADVNHDGHAAIHKWYTDAFQRFNRTSFKMNDASAGIFPNGQAFCIVWFELKQKGKAKKHTHVECLEVSRNRSKWECTRCFGIGYSPIEHRNSFK